MYYVVEEGVAFYSIDKIKSNIDPIHMKRYDFFSIDFDEMKKAGYTYEDGEFFDKDGEEVFPYDLKGICISEDIELTLYRNGWNGNFYEVIDDYGNKEIGEFEVEFTNGSSEEILEKIPSSIRVNDPIELGVKTDNVTPMIWKQWGLK